MNNPSGILPPRPAGSSGAGTHRSPGGTSVPPPSPAGRPPRFARFCPRQWALRERESLRHAVSVFPPPSPGAGSNSPRTSGSRSYRDYPSDLSRIPRGTPHRLPARPYWPSPSYMPPTPPASRYRTACLTASARPRSSSQVSWLTERTSHGRPGPFTPLPPRQAGASPLIPVGTALTGGPPDRSRRAELAHRAPALGPGGEAHAGVGMHDAGRGQPLLLDPAIALPGHAMALAPAPERLNPVPPDLVAEGRDQIDVAGHGVVVEVSPQHARQPAPLLGDGPVTAPPKLGFHLLQLRPQPLFDGDAPEPEAPVPRLPANVGEAQEVERLRLCKAPLSPVRSRKAAELDEAGLVRVQFQIELRKPLSKVVKEPFCIPEVLEPDHEVVREPHDDHVTMCVAASPPIGPLVEDVMKVHVREQR